MLELLKDLVDDAGVCNRLMTEKQVVLEKCII